MSRTSRGVRPVSQYDAMMAWCAAMRSMDKFYVVDPKGLEWETYAVTDDSTDGLGWLGTDNCCT